MCSINWTLTLEYLKVFLSWPVVVLILALIIIYKFKQSFSDFLSRITKGEGYGVKIEATPPQEQAYTKDLNKQVSDISGEPEKWVQDNPKQALEEYQRVFNSYKWERATNFIYGTQIDMLDALSKEGETGVLYVNLALYHAEHQRRIGHSTYQMPDYINFLQQQGFITTEGADSNLKIKITPYGLCYLSYIKANYPDTWDKKLY